MALWRCTQMERRCRRKFISRSYPETDEMRRPNSERNSAPSAFTGPRVSKAMGTNTWVAGNNAYLAVLRTAACSAAEPAEIAVCDKYDAAQVWTTVAYHVSSSRPGNECDTIGPLAISSQKTRWSLHAWNICTLIYGMMILLFITISKKSYGIVDKNILCRIINIQSDKLVFCVQYFLIFTVSCSSCHSLKSVSRTLSCCIDNCLNKKNKTNTRLTFLPLFLIC